MDDRTFDHQTAFDWIAAIEKPGQNVRDVDIYPMLNAWIRQASPETILDIGCGQGICSEKIDLVGRKYTGIDPSPFLIDRAKEKYSSKSRAFLGGNAYDLPLPDASFDAAFSVLVWHLLSDSQRAASELGRVLSVEGHFLIITANPDALSAWRDMYVEANVSGTRLEGTMRKGGVPFHDVLYLRTLDEIGASLRPAGLEILNTNPFRPAKGSGEGKLLIAIYGRKVW